MLETVYFTDLDRTLFDTDAYYPVLRSTICATEGVDCEMYEKEFLAYLSASTKPGSSFDYLEAVQGVPKKKLYARLEKSLGDRSFLFPDSLAFLKRHNNSTEKVIILTYGEEEFQRFKVEREPELAQLPCIVVQENKANWFSRMLAHGELDFEIGGLKVVAQKAIFIDDSPEHFVKTTVHPGLSQVLIQRSSEQNKPVEIDFPVNTIQSLDEI